MNSLQSLAVSRQPVLFRARYVMPMSAPIIEDGAVVVQDGIIVAVGTYLDLARVFRASKSVARSKPMDTALSVNFDQGSMCSYSPDQNSAFALSHQLFPSPRCERYEISGLKQQFFSAACYQDLGDVILMPGLINAHCHLDYTMMKNQLQAGSGFTAWVQDLNKIKFKLQEAEVMASMIEGVRELQQWGCTTAVNIVAFPQLLEKLSVSSLRLWQLIEVMDIRGPHQGEEGMKVAENFFAGSYQSGKDQKIKFGISPHAPQTSSQRLYQASAQLSKKYHIPFCTHLAESEEEFEMFMQKSGVLFDFLKSFGRDMSDCGFQTPVQALLNNDLLPYGSLLVHMNCLTETDRKLLAQRADDFFIVHCPKTHRFFDRAPFDWKFFYHHGYRLSLGTDSLASNDELNLFSEMQLFAKTAPDLVPEEILKMVTLNPAEALGMKGRLGELSPGAFAEMIAIPFLGKRTEVAEAIIQNKTVPEKIFSK